MISNDASPDSAGQTAGPVVATAHRSAKLLRAPEPTEWLVAVAVVAGIAIAACTPRAFTVVNGEAILYSASTIGIAALGVTLIMICGGLVSLAVGETAAIGGLIFLPNLTHGLVVALVLSMAVAGAATALQGLAIGAWQTNPIIVTIAAASILTAVGEHLDANPVLPGSNAYQVLNETVHGVPISVFALLGLTVGVQQLLSRTRFGRLLYLIGDNRAAARAAGLPLARTVTVAFGVAGALFAISGAFLASSSQTVTLQGTSQLTFNAIAAVLAGGSAITGGFGSATRTLVGALLIAAISDLMLLRGYDIGVQGLVEGLIVLAVVLLGHLRYGRRTS
jgi:ribose/xylose/arabinose/galactoside ABC-type transport system permease subunit